MSALENSVTLEDVFQVVRAGPVLMQGELAGYLALEIAEGAVAGAGAGDIDARAVFIGEQGSVALVRPKADPAAAAAGDPEASVREILATLLAASKSKTPGLESVAKARNGAGLRKLIEELERALIPINRAAGRRGLARLAREVKRVTQGVGRNARRARDAGAGDDLQPRSAREPFSTAPSSTGIQSAAHALGESRRPSAARDELAELLDNRPSDRMPAAPSTSVSTKSFEPQAEPRAGVRELAEQFGVSGPTDDAAMARELKALAGLDATPPPVQADAFDTLLAKAATDSSTSVLKDAAKQDANADGVEALLASGMGAPPALQPETLPAPPEPEEMSDPPPASKAPAPVQAVAKKMPELHTVTGEAKGPEAVAAVVARPQDARNAPTMKMVANRGGGGSGKLLLPIAIIVAMAAAAAVFVMKPAIFGQHDTSPVPTASGPAPTSSGSAATPKSSAVATHDPTRCRAILNVTDAPSGAEILLREGFAPLDVERMPVGARLEFVATDDGYAPKRIVVPADSTWDHGADGRPRFELGVQLDGTKAKLGQVDPWPPAEPGSEAGGNGPAGTVHIVSTPKGAELWLLAGIGPTAKIDQQVRCDADLDVLIAGPTSFRKRMHKSGAELAQLPSETGANGILERTVTLSAK